MLFKNIAVTLRLIILVALLSAAIGPLHSNRQIAVSHAQSSAQFEEVDCADDFPFLEGVDGLICGYLYTLENRDDPQGYEVQLAVVILESFSDAPQPDPVLYLEGGPGGSAIIGVDTWLNHPMRDTRDIVLYDQRGTGFSYPFLGCTELYEEDASDEDSALQAFEDCKNRLEADEVDLSRYTSIDSAMDIEDLRITLGYDEWNIFGISYGTRLALTLMDFYPDSVRSVIIDSVYPPHINAYEQQAVGIADAILRMLRACAADADCNADYPDIEATFYAMVNDLNDAPVDVEVEDDDGTVSTESYYGDDIIDAMGQWLYDQNIIPYLPRLVAELAFGETATLQLLLDEAYDVPEDPFAGDDLIDYDLLDEYSDLGDSDGMFYSVECAEEIPFNQIDVATALIEPYPDELEIVLIDDALGIWDICAIWDVTPAPSEETQPIQSEVPTLVMAGEFDPITPTAWAFSAAGYLSQGYAYEFPAVGHGASAGGACPMDMMLAFLDNPNQAPDSSCIASMPSTQWVGIDD